MFFSKLSYTAKTMCGVIGIIFGGFLLVGLIVSIFIYRFESPLAYSVGLFLGSALSLVKVILLEKALNSSVELESQKAKNYSSLQAILRYALTIIVLLLVVFFPKVFGLFGAIIGVLSLQLAAYITTAVLKNKDSQI